MVYNLGGTIYIIATIKQDEENEFKKQCVSIYPNVIIECNYENDYEFPGILKVWKLGQIHNKSNDIILYFHSKGMVFNNDSSTRTDFERTTLRATLFYWRRAMELFKTVVNINKVGLWPSIEGYIWVNFFYIRGGYLENPPEISTDRFYYETYIKNEFIKNRTSKNRSYLDCYSLIKDRVCWIHPDNIKDDRELVLTIDQKF
jgi:hypothetical protein